MVDGSSIAFALACTLLTEASAQTFLVDASGGSGSHYTSIAAAVAAVPDGAVLQVLPGTYGAFQISAKGLLVLGGPQVIVQDTVVPLIDVRNIASHQTVTLRELALTSPATAALIEFANSSGPIVLEACIGDVTTSPGGAGVFASHCAHLHLHGCSFQPSSPTANPLKVTACHTTVSGCSLSGLGGATVLINGGYLDIVASMLFGLATTPTVQLNGGEVTLRGVTRVRSAISQTLAALAIAGSGTARVDPNTVFTNTLTPPYAPTVAVQSIEQPWLLTEPGSLGGIARGIMHWQAAGVGILSLGFPGPAVAVPPIAGRIWFQPGTEHMRTLGPAPLTSTYAVPNAPWIVGVTVAWQGALLPFAGGIELSNPGVYAHR